MSPKNIEFTLNGLFKSRKNIIFFNQILMFMIILLRGRGHVKGKSHDYVNGPIAKGFCHYPSIPLHRILCVPVNQRLGQ
jgi:hypothetical protein